MDFSISDLDLTQIPFSRAFARLMVFCDRNIPDPEAETCDIPPEDRNRPLLYISLTPAPGRRAPRRGLLRLMPLEGERELAYTWHASADELTVETEAGALRLAFEKGGALRIRGQIALSLRPAGEVRAEGQTLDWGEAGRVRLVPLAGTLSCAESGEALVRPDGSGSFELALCNGQAECHPEQPFDEVVQEAAAALRRWQQRYGPLRREYRDILEFCTYYTWICLKNEEGNLSLLARRNGLIRVTPWEQGLAALSMVGDGDCAASFLRNIPIPGNVSYDDPPLQGVAALRLMAKGLDLSAIYEPLTQYFRWWMENRYSPEFELPAYIRSHKRGFGRLPGAEANDQQVLSPDLPAYLALVAEALQCMAIGLGRPDEAAEWEQTEAKLIDGLVGKLWDGRVFVSRRGAEGKVFDSGSSLQLLPLILGERLPIKVLDTLVADIERDQLCERGVRDFSDSDGVYLPAQVVFMLAFLLIERAEVATTVARGVISYVLECGFVPQSYGDGRHPDPREDYAPPCTVWSSVVATVVLALASMME